MNRTAYLLLSMCFLVGFAAESPQRYLQASTKVLNRLIEISLAERDTLELEVSLHHPTNEKEWETENFQFWILNRNGGCQRQIRPLQPIVGIANAGWTQYRSRAEFEKLQLEDVAAVVVSIKGSMSIFQISSKDFREIKKPEVPRIPAQPSSPTLRDKQ